MGDTLTAPPRRSHVIYGALIVTAGIAILVIIGFLLLAKPHAAQYVVYIPGDPNLDTQTDVMYHGEDVGRVSSVEHFVIAMPLTVSAQDELVQVTGAATLAAGQAHLRIDAANIDLSYAPHTVVVRRGADADTLERVGADAWRPRSGSPRTFRMAAGNVTLRTGDILDLGGVLLKWADETPCMRLTLAVDSTLIHKSIGAAIAPGTIVTVRTNFGLSRPALTLEPAFSHMRLVTGAAMPELPAKVGVNMDAIVDEIAGYAFTPGASTAAPRNRFEQLIAGMNSSVDNLNSFLSRVRVMSDIDSGNCLFGRLLLTPNDRHNISAALAGADSLVAALNTAGGVGRVLLSRAQQDTITSIIGAAKLLMRHLDTTGGVGNALLTHGERDSVNALVASVNAFIGDLAKDGSLQRLALKREQQDSVKDIINNIHTLTDGVNGKVANSVDNVVGKATAFGITTLVLQLVTAIGAIWVATKIH